MIPDDLDDGFSVELQPGVVCRPMLLDRHLWWKERAREFPEGALKYILNPPYSFLEFEPQDHLAKEIVQTVMEYPSKVEQQDLQDLADTVSLQTTNLGMSLLHCDDCREYCVDHETGEIQSWMGGILKPLPPGWPVPCETRQGCPKGHHDRPKGLSNPRWVKTWGHYWKYRDQPTDRLRTDPIFVRNRILLDWIVDYGRDARFDPFAGGGPRRRRSPVQASGADVSGSGGQSSS